MQPTRWVRTGLLGWLLILALAWPGTSPLCAQDGAPAAPKVHSDTPTESLPADNMLRRPLESPSAPAPAALPAVSEPLLQTYVEPPLGFTGPSGVRPSAAQEDSHFVPVEDRWRIGFPEW